MQANETKHTPGPWRVGGLDKCDVMGPRLSIDGSGRQTGTFAVAQCTGYKAEREANAALIAAAPELLEACKALFAADEAICENVGRKSDQAMNRIAALDMAQRAINKAEGR